MSPIYDFQCPQCKLYFKDVNIKNLKERQLCPDCGIECERLFPTKTSVQYKTSGFHKTDYKDYGN